jgi:hypothetical protein
MKRARAMPRFSCSSSFLLAAATVALACGAGCSSRSSSTGSGGAGGAPSPCYDYATFDGSAPVETFQADVLPILRTSCGLSTSCHGTVSPDCAASFWEPPTNMQQYYGPALNCGTPTAAQIALIFSNAVGVKSVEETEMDIIDPGNPEQSFLMYKVDGTLTCPTLVCSKTPGACFNPMPSGSPLIAASDRDVIRRWIAQGAKND